MSLGYELTITDSSGQEIKLSSFKGGYTGEPDIINASYKSNTLKDEALSRSNDVRAEIQICGKITKENKAETNKLAAWAIDSNSETIYRTVKLIVHPTTSDPNVLRSYEIEHMFVLDYDECFDCNNGLEDIDSGSMNETNDCGIFKLFVVQKSGNYTQYIENE